MTLDELQAKWAEQDQKLDTVICLNRQLLTQNKLGGARTALRRQTVFAIWNAVASSIVVPLMVWFVVNQHAEMKFVIAAALIVAYFFGTLCAHIRQAWSLSRINYSEPITVIQRQIEKVVRMRVRLAQWLSMSMVLLWVPISIVAAKAFFNADLYVLSPRWLVINTAVGFAWIGLVLWWIKRGAASSRSACAQRFVREVAGYNMNAAKAFIASLDDFEKEE